MKFFKSLLLVFVLSTVFFSCHNEVEPKDELILASDFQEIRIGK